MSDNGAPTIAEVCDRVVTWVKAVWTVVRGAAWQHVPTLATWRHRLLWSAQGFCTCGSYSTQGPWKDLV